MKSFKSFEIGYMRTQHIHHIKHQIKLTVFNHQKMNSFQIPISINRFTVKYAFNNYKLPI